MPVDKAREHIRAFLSPVTTVERLNIRAALGRVLAEDVISPLNVPQHDNSAMDGYAVRFDDLKPDGETVLQVIGTSLAGKPFAGTLSSGQAARIMTGAVVPAGADSIVQQERAKASGDQVAVSPLPKKGTNLRQAGEDLRRGEAALKRGQLLRPAEVGMLASL
ncbi:MAG TPA: molybdopterin molybdenumtransferase MoeA, partial [Burkholderiales bacterium]